MGARILDAAEEVRTSVARREVFTHLIDCVTHDRSGRIETLQMRKLYDQGFGLPLLRKRFR